jgi:murein DD-endopeptidase MepM/ murein hydrolase activator NlpD
MNLKRLFCSVVLALIAGSLAATPHVANTQQPICSDFGGGEYALEKHGPALSERQRQSVQTEIRANVRQLQLPAPNQPRKVTLAWPLQPAPGLDDYGYHGISGFVDHDPAYPDHLLDYNCGDRTYDTDSGYNHEGTDFFTWPFSWNKMDHDEVQVVAAADGLIVYKQDGHYDRNCGFGQGDANLVAVRHGDGSTAWYLHLKRGSLTSKTIGATVAQGEYLGVVGSSGNSTGPHLHFEVHDGLGHLIDPYQGACNSLNPDSWWDEQRPYYDPAVNKLSTGAAPPVFPACPEPEISHERTVFFPGETIYFTTYYRDQLAGLTSQYAIYEPDDSVYHSWSHSMNEDHYAASYWYWSFVLGSAVLTGTWRFEVTFDGQTYSRDFNVLEPSHLVYLPIVTR